MSKETTTSKDIDNYLSGELSPEHLAEFEKRLSEDNHIQEDLNATKKVIEGVQGYAFKNMLKDLHNKLFNDSQT